MKKPNKIQRLQSAIPTNDKLMLESIAKKSKTFIAMALQAAWL